MQKFKQFHQTSFKRILSESKSDTVVFHKNFLNNILRDFS